MMENWSDIIGFPEYQISDLGRVKSLKKRTANVMAATPNTNGHLYVKLRANGRYHKQYVHRLVATAYIQNPNNFPVVNHIDANPQNNAVSNLEWCTQKSNMLHASECGLMFKKLTREDATVIRASSLSVHELASRYHVSVTAINHVLNGKNFQTR